MKLLDKVKSYDLSLFKNIFNYGIGGILPQLIGFITLPIFSIHLTPDDYGTLEVIYYFNLFLTIMMRIGLPGVISRFYYDYGEGKELREYVSTIFWTVMVSSTLIGLVAAFVLYFFQPTYLDGKSFVVFGLIPIATAVLNANTDIQRRLIQARQQSKYSMYLSFAITIVGVIVAYPFIVTMKLGATGSLISNLIITIIFFIQAQHYLNKDIGFTYSKVLLPESLKYAAGILPSHIINNLVPFANRLFVAERISVSTLANLSIANRFGAAYMLIIGALQNAYLPQYFSLRKQGDEGMKKIIKFNSTILTASCAIALIFTYVSPYIIEVILPQKYHGSYLYFPIFSLGFLGQIFYTLYGQEIFYNKKTKFHILISIASIVPNVLCVLITSNHNEAFSIAWGVTIGNMTAAIIGFYLSNRYIHLRIEKSVKYFLVLTLALILFYFFLNSAKY